MQLRLEPLLRHFDDTLLALSHEYRVEMLAERIAVISPKARVTSQTGRDVDLTLLGLVHGVEVAGLAVLSAFLDKLKSREIELEESIGIAVGNVPAAKLSQRFVERDLNRSFGREATATAEDRRADEIELLFKRTKYLLDFHQVKLTTANPFWIFPYHKEGYSFARSVAPEVPLITHWGPSFSADGQCSDEFIMKQGACGVTIELGQNGFDPAQISYGLRVATAALDEVRVRVGGHTRGPRLSEKHMAPIYTWASVIPYPATGAPVLDAGWSNFAPVSKGQRLGQFGEQIINAPESGFILFPKYPDLKPNGDYGLTPPAAELVRILKPISESELPFKRII